MMDFYPSLCLRYKSMLLNAPVFSINDFDNTNHLLWMINELENNLSQSLTKKHRWLGYIQHAVISQGITDVMTEREFTRDIFKGN
mgnify:CR=1 FL=1